MALRTSQTYMLCTSSCFATALCRRHILVAKLLCFGPLRVAAAEYHMLW